MQNKQGTTLIEVLLYIAIVSVVTLAITELSLNLIQGRVKSSVIENVTYNMRFSSRFIVNTIRNALSIIESTGTSLCLESSNSAQNPTRIYLENNSLFVGYGRNCSVSDSTYPLTSNNVIVTNLTFLKTTDSQNLSFSYNLQSSANSGRKEWNYATVASGSATLH